MSRTCSQPFPQDIFFMLLILLFGATHLQAQKQPVGIGKPVDARLIQTFPEPEPQADETAIAEQKTVLRAEIAIDTTTTVRFYEKPTSDTVYNSSISIERANASIATYEIGKMINHQPLRLVHAALIRSGTGGILVCEYEGGAVGAKEGFAILRFSPAGFALHTLPLTEFGKVVVFKSKPDQAEIWSALPDDVGSNADPMVYATQNCRWQEERYSCGAQRTRLGRFSPASIDDPGIEIRP